MSAQPTDDELAAINERIASNAAMPSIAGYQALVLDMWDALALRDGVVAAAVEWEAAHTALSLDKPTGPADADLLERYSEACVELLAAVSQNRAALARPAEEERG